MVIKIVKLTGTRFPTSFKYDETRDRADVALSGVEQVQVETDDHQHVIQVVHDIELGEIRVMHITQTDEEPECVLSVLQ